MSRFVTSLLAAGLFGLFAFGCDGGPIVGEPGTAGAALIVLDKVTPVVATVVDVRLHPTAALVGLHTKVEHRVHVSLRATAQTPPGPCPPPVDLDVDIAGADLVRPDGTSLTLGADGTGYAELELAVDPACAVAADCLATLAVTAQRLDAGPGRVTLAIDVE